LITESDPTPQMLRNMPLIYPSKQLLTRQMRVSFVN
jgi:hypothetical protein